jgi:hypothetical protein
MEADITEIELALRVSEQSLKPGSPCPSIKTLPLLSRIPCLGSLRCPFHAYKPAYCRAVQIFNVSSSLSKSASSRTA